MAKEQTTIRYWIESFLLDRRVRQVSPNTIRFYKQKFDAFLPWCEGEGIEEIRDFTANHLRLFLLYLQERGNNAGGRHGFYRGVRALLHFYENEAEPQDWVNPISKVSAPRLAERPIDPVKVEEVSLLLEYCKPQTFYGIRDKAILLVLLDTGLRASELLGIDFEDLNLIQNLIQIRNGKGNKVRIVFFGKKTKKALRLWIKKRPKKIEPLFCTQRGERLKYSGLRMMLERKSKAAGIEGVSLHDFRRAFCLAQLNHGTPETSIARLMGHSNTQLIARYAKQTTRNLQSAFHSIGDSEL